MVIKLDYSFFPQISNYSRHLCLKFFWLKYNCPHCIYHSNIPMCCYLNSRIRGDGEPAQTGSAAQEFHQRVQRLTSQTIYPCEYP